MDTVSEAKRSWNMSRIHSENTKPEIQVRSFLHQHGFRFRLHVKRLPGKPDIVIAKYKTAIEIRGCFWHHHKGCKIASTPSSNVEYWNKKFEKNIARDHETENAIKALGWNLIVIWECELKKPGVLEHLPFMIRNAAIRSSIELTMTEKTGIEHGRHRIS
jgi:DNA mismatch endonuclease Vsr